MQYPVGSKEKEKKKKKGVRKVPEAWGQPKKDFLVM